MSVKQVKEIKRHILALIEEYSTNATKSGSIEEYLNVTWSDDADINTKLIPLINLQYQFLANQEGIIRLKDISITDNTDNPNYYTKYSLAGASKLRSVEILESDLDTINYKYLNGKLYVKNTFTGIIEVEYNAYADDLTEIDDNDIDDYELEISQNACVALCYMVAGDILITDTSANYTAFSQKASQIIQALDNETNSMIGIVEQVDLRGI
ncbi:hypothetical protein [uncultured Anaerofustis sp.]|uniref:hypothetical protein n=1 Tax=uncultured Anaerofustis sp. TaxID=904996 RepID=UPI0025EC751D|nr:hypothetical protein [uncultured Anaerofustis sp.]